MKQIKILLIVVLFCFGMVPVGWGYTINDIDAGAQNGTDVGDLDSIIQWIDWQSAGYSSNPASETAWVNTLPGLGSATFQVKNEENLPIFDTNGSGVYAVYLPTPPVSDYFLLKNGNYWALYSNTISMDWGVFDATLLPTEMNLPGGYTVSHVTRFGDPVPIPGAILLLGSGLIGLAGISRKYKLRRG